MAKVVKIAKALQKLPVARYSKIKKTVYSKTCTDLWATKSIKPTSETLLPVVLLPMKMTIAQIKASKKRRKYCTAKYYKQF